MVKRFVILLLIAAWSMVNGQWSMAQTAAIRVLYSLVRNTSYETKADSMTNAFIESFMIKDKGIFNDRYKKYADNAYWTQAHAIDVVIYNYERHKDIDGTLARKYLNYIKLWYKNKANNYSGAAAASSTTPNINTGYKMFENPFTDDMCWITLALLHIGEATGTSSYSVIARQVFDNYIIKRAHYTEDSTAIWLPWNNESGSGPNACTMSPATLIAAKLYQKYGTEKYLDYAKKLYKYTATNLVESDGRVEEPPLTYTQGTFAEACRILFHVTDEGSTMKAKYKNFAYTYLNYAFTSDRCTSQGYLRDEGHDGNQSIFKAVLIPYAVNYVLDESMPQTSTQPYRKNILNLILKNTNIMWKKLDKSRYPLVFCNYDWTQPYTGADNEASMGAACSGSSLMENTARMCVAIVDRYNLGVLYTQCNKFVVEPALEGEAEMIAFNAAKSTAAEIMANPGDYTHAQFLQAIEALETAYQAAQDFATGIKDLKDLKDPKDLNDIWFDLSGRIVNRKSLNGKPHGIYIKDGRKTYIR